MEESPKTSTVKKLIRSMPATCSNQISVTASMYDMAIFMLCFRKQCQEDLVLVLLKFHLRVLYMVTNDAFKMCWLKHLNIFLIVPRTGKIL